MKKTRFALFQSIVALILCVSMLTGTTFAWFNDSVSSTNNLIASGILDVELEYLVDGEWVPVTKETEVLDKNALWEPGYTEVAYLKVRNEGNLALKYAFGVGILKEIGSINSAGQKFFLSDYIKFGVIESDTQPNFSTREDARKALTSSNLIVNGYSSENELPLYPKNNADNLPNERYVTLVVYIPEEVGNAANYATGATIPEIELGIQLMATQAEYESDSFGTDYDKNAKRDDFYFPVERIEISSSAGVDAGSDNKVANAVILEKDQARAVIPEGVLLYQDTNLLTLEVRSMDATGSNVTLEETEVIRSLDVHVIGVSKDNTVPMEITIKEAAAKGLNSTSIKLYHVENGETKKMDAVDTFTAHNQFKYDPATGDITLYMATFSEVALVADTENAWEGEFDYDWYDASKTELTIANADQLAAFGAIVGGMNGKTQDSFSGKTVKLIADVNLGDKESENNPDLIFHPIGYYYKDGDSTVKSFEGTFDGNGHTIANFYQNTWEIKGDYDGNYYKDAMGLFGRVYKGTVKNLTVKDFSSDGEYTTTGCIAAYADGATFENIAITNCNPRVYNIGNGGIVGCVGWYAKEAGLTTTFKNITVDNSNKISALWGSYDVACGGIVGQYYPTSGQSSAGTPANGGVHFENCHIAAQMDVYNDVCGNYQYYAYRYAGMLIGSVRENVTIDGHVYPKMDGITAEGCTVHFGTWNDYYYCEFEKNGHPSYSGPDDYKFSRVDKGELTIKADGTIECNHPNYTHTDVEDNRAIYLPFNNLVTGYGWGVTTKVVGELEGVTILDREVADSVGKFAKADTAKDSYESDVPVTIGELFKAAEITDLKLSIKAGQVQVTVSPVGDDSTAGGIYEANTNDWTKGTLTFSGVGTAQITITDYYFCTPTTITVDVTERTDAEKFASKFTGNFLYRVGNQNTVSLGSLFAAAPKKDADGNELKDESGKPVCWDINNSGAEVTIETVDGNASGTFTANADDWTKGTIQFSGTGAVKITITDKDYCIPTELYLEVINATNVPENGKISNYGVSSVLLGNTSVNTLYLNGGATLYGNGFTIDCTDSPVTGTGSVSENYVICLNGAHLDNVKVIGLVYTKYGAMASNDYNRALVVSKGNSSITNCYLSNTAAPIRLVEGSLVVKDTTVKGGNFANIDVRNGHLTLEDVTTINQANGNDDSTVIGLGIVVYYENVDTSLTSVNVKGTLTQYNNISSKDSFSNDYAKQFVNAMMGESYADIQYKDANGTTWVNPGIISMTAGMEENIKGTVKSTHTFKTARFLSVDGCTYTQVPTADTTGSTPAEYNTNGQGAIAPAYSFDYTTKNYIAKTDDSNDYCYYEGGKVLIAMDQGDTFEWDPFILTATKNGQTLDYTVAMNGKTYARGEKIAFNTSGDYAVTYTYTDNNNYKLRNVDTYEQTYVKTVNISVSVIKPTAKHATFTFADTNTATEKITVNDKTYISAKGVSATDKEWGYITVNGTKVFYPITEAQFKKATLKSEYTVYYYVFNGAVTITDYKDGGTGSEQIYNGSTTTMPSNLTVVNGMEAKYTAISSACVDISKLTKDGPSGEVWDFSSSSTVSGTTKYNDYLAHQSPSGLAVKSGTRDYDAITVAQFSYTDAAGATYYYFIGYFMPNQNTSNSESGGGSNPCVTGDAQVTLANGTKKRIDQVTYGDRLLAWDFFKGEFTAVSPAIIFDHGYDNNTVIELKFSDGTTVKAVTLHQFFDADLNELVTIDAESAADYVGHKFAKKNGNGYKMVELVDYTVSQQYIDAWGIISAEHYNIFVEDMLSTDFIHEDYPLFNYFEVGKNMTFDQQKMKADIAKYGLYTYADFAEYLTPEQFAAFNVQYFKIPVGKGEYTYEGILELIKQYLN